MNRACVTPGMAWTVFRKDLKRGTQDASKVHHINLLISTRHKLSFSMSGSPETGFFSVSAFEVQHGE